MTKATTMLVDELSKIIDKYKFLLLTGGTAVGKTFIASAIVDNCLKPEYNAQGDLLGGQNKYDCEVEFVPTHPSLTYEDVVSGLSIHTENGNVLFTYEDKLILSFLKKANTSWQKKEQKKYFLILDDIGRGSISGMLGDLLPLIEPHGDNVKGYKKIYKKNAEVWVSPNIYIIATRSSIVNLAERFNYGFLRHFYEKTIENDFLYMSDNATSSYSNYDINANAMYYRARRIVLDNLRHRFQMPENEQNKYIIGHGVFKETGISTIVKCQVVPMLKQYVKDGILDKTAKISIDALDKLVHGKYSKDITYADTDRIVIRKKGVTAQMFQVEGETHQPLVNLVSRIKEQGLINDTTIAEEIMFNPKVIVRKKARIYGVEQAFPKPGYLYIEKQNISAYKSGAKDSNNQKPRTLYSGNKKDVIELDGVEYAIAKEMQPREFMRNYEELINSDNENDRNSSSPNSIMFRILKSYYNALIHQYSSYLLEFPGDENISKLNTFADQEYQWLVSETRKLHPETSDAAAVNLKANDDFRKVISKLTLFWKNRGEIIDNGGQIIKAEGVYKVDNSKKYEEYTRAMETLGIHQMIMQGPPGTSKTYSAREYLKYVGKPDGQKTFLTDSELDSYQIRNYSDTKLLSEWVELNPGKTPAIAWDIVQFHPSYGYEDFVRGIEVSTVKASNTNASTISYETVNKILGEMAEVAARPEYAKTKFYLLIDEINRANLATVFGELIYGLEYRGRSVATPYTVAASNKVSLPNNLYILGTMNTADKSIGGIDYAIRRRFLFFSLLPEKETILDYKKDSFTKPNDKKKQIAINKKAAALFDSISELFSPDILNNEYYKDDVQIGHTYFLVSSEEQLYLRFRYQIIPILKEYCKDGMFQFDRFSGSNDGFTGLLACITGEIDINDKDDYKVKEIFDKLVNKPD